MAESAEMLLQHPPLPKLGGQRDVTPMLLRLWLPPPVGLSSFNSAQWGLQESPHVAGLTVSWLEEDIPFIRDSGWDGTQSANLSKFPYNQISGTNGLPKEADTLCQEVSGYGSRSTGCDTIKKHKDRFVAKG